MLKTLVKTCFDFLMPPRCKGCGECVTEPSSLCSLCWSNLTFIHDPACDRCGAPLAFDGMACYSCPKGEFECDHVTAALVYNDPIKKLLTRFKHSHQTNLRYLFAPWIHNRFKPITDYNAIIPVPLHRFRLMQRGYNQATLIAKILPAVGPLDISLLKRIRYTKSQGHRSPNQRFDNVDSAFDVSTLNLEGQSFLLVDDVMTSGATLSACAAALKDAGAEKVDAFVLARALL